MTMKKSNRTVSRKRAARNVAKRPSPKPTTAAQPSAVPSEAIKSAYRNLRETQLYLGIVLRNVITGEDKDMTLKAIVQAETKVHEAMTALTLDVEATAANMRAAGLDHLIPFLPGVTAQTMLEARS
jgi:hypothetical protein